MFEWWPEWCSRKGETSKGMIAGTKSLLKERSKIVSTSQRCTKQGLVLTLRWKKSCERLRKEVNVKQTSQRENEWIDQGSVLGWPSYTDSWRQVSGYKSEAKSASRFFCFSPPLVQVHCRWRCGFNQDLDSSSKTWLPQSFLEGPLWAS